MYVLSSAGFSYHETEIHRTVVSDGARDFVRANVSRAGFGVQTTHPDELVAPRARDDWIKWKERLVTVSESTHTGDHDQMAGLHDIQDTVGAVAWVEGDGAAAGVSR